MTYERATRDGRREFRIEDEIVEVPHDYEIAPSALFPETARQAFSAQLVAGARGQSFMWGKVHLAAALDLLAMKEHLTSEAAPMLDQAINLLVETAIQSTSPAGLEAMSDQLAEAAIRARRIVTTEPDDEEWYRGTDRRFDAEIDQMFAGKCNEPPPELIGFGPF